MLTEQKFTEQKSNMV